MQKATVKGSGAVAKGKGNVASGEGGRSAGRDMVNIEIHQQAPGEDGVELRKAYLRSILRDCRPLSLAGVDPAVAASGDRGASLRLDAVYTALMTQNSTGEQGALFERGGRREMSPQRLHDAFLRSRSCDRTPATSVSLAASRPPA